MKVGKMQNLMILLQYFHEIVYFHGIYESTVTSNIGSGGGGGKTNIKNSSFIVHNENSEKV